MSPPPRKGLYAFLGGELPLNFRDCPRVRQRSWSRGLYQHRGKGNEHSVGISGPANVCNGSLSAATVLGGKPTLRRYSITVNCFVTRAAVVGTFLLSACASIGPTRVEDTITVARRPWFGICGGVCPNYDVTVWPDGRVLAVQHYWSAPDEVERFRLSPEEAVHFRRILAPYRPARGGHTPPCQHDVPPKQASMVRHVTEIEITWLGSPNPAQLVACDAKETAGLKEAIRKALWSAHLYIGGERRD